jgi:hypothetical protein
MLEKANENLEAVDKLKPQSLETTTVVNERLQLLLEKQAAVASLIKEKKMQILEVVVPLARLMKQEYYYWGGSSYYMVNSSAKPIVFGERNSTRNDCSFSEFADSYYLVFHCFCRAVMDYLPKFLEENPKINERQAEEITELNKLLKQLRKLAQKEIPKA